MTSIIKLRIINSIGCILFVIYGLNVHAYPVAISNALIILINIYNLYVLLKNIKSSSILLELFNVKIINIFIFYIVVNNGNMI